MLSTFSIFPSPKVSLFLVFLVAPRFIVIRCRKPSSRSVINFFSFLSSLLHAPPLSLTMPYSQSTNYSKGRISRSALTTKPCSRCTLIVSTNAHQSFRYDIAVRALKVKSPSFEDLNGVRFLPSYGRKPPSHRSQLISRVMCGVSTSLRFPGQLNGYESNLLVLVQVKLK